MPCAVMAVKQWSSRERRPEAMQNAISVFVNRARSVPLRNVPDLQYRY